MTPSKFAYLVFLACMFALVGMLGCGGLTKEQQEKVDNLSKMNEDLGKKAEATLERARLGLITPAEMISMIDEIKVTLKKNRDEIKAVYDEAGAKATISGVLSGTFGRSALHIVAGFIPVGHPIGAMIHGALMLLLGGSSTEKKTAAVPPPNPTPA